MQIKCQCHQCLLMLSCQTVAVLFISRSHIHWAMKKKMRNNAQENIIKENRCMLLEQDMILHRFVQRFLHCHITYCIDLHD